MVNPRKESNRQYGDTTRGDGKMAVKEGFEAAVPADGQAAPVADLHWGGLKAGGPVTDKLETLQPVKAHPPSWSPAPGEGRLHFIKRVTTEGHTVVDAFLTVSAAQIGQILLTLPNAISKTGFIAGTTLAIGSAILALWTMYLLASLYLERKRSLVKSGEWYGMDGKRHEVTQYHDVIRFHMGPVVGVIAQILVALSLAGIGIAQVIACAGDAFYIDRRFSKRQYELIFGGMLMIFAFVPTFRHYRILNLVAVVGTTYTCLYILVTASLSGIKPGLATKPPASPQAFFLGSAIILQAMGAHPIALEMMDAMRDSRKYVGAYFGGWLWTALLTLPHSLAVNLAYPAIIVNDNVYGVLPLSNWMRVSVALMIVHQFVAFALYVTPLIFMFERLWGSHNARWFIRLPLRLPVALILWLLGVMLPFYGTINSLMGAIGVPTTAFVLPAIAYNWHFRSRETREAATSQPPRWLAAHGWLPCFLLNYCIIAVFSVFTVGGIFFSIQRIVQQSYSFGLFAECYQCPPKNSVTGLWG
ncbi:hypothetical protein WJX81_007976 [Elliptochloris bilobata]|uniref:Amino acid transporter transmembrane domain-containing protein n=1 Tax=Elliptochloris bilobata TaxID=381761 RepID=A0AAW1RC28_9CHLO